MSLASPEDRFVELYDEFYDDIYRYCLRRTGHTTAEDVVSSVFATAWKRIDAIPDGREALFWLYRVSYRMIGRQWRGASRRRNLETKLRGLGIEPSLPPDDFVVQNEQSQNVLAAVSRLNHVDREVLFLAVWEQLPQAEIAETLEISVGAVKQRMHRARRNLAKAYRRIEPGASFVAAPQKEGGP